MKTTIKKGKELSEKDFDFIVKTNIKNFNDCKDYEKELKTLKKEDMNSYFFFLKEKNKIVSFGLLRKIKINYLKKYYNIFGISNIVSVIKKKGYGKILINKMRDFSLQRNKTAIGFCGEHNIKFYQKAGINVKRNLKNRFFYNYGSKKENKGHMQDPVIYWEGKNKFITKIMKTKSLIKIPCEHW